MPPATLSLTESAEFTALIAFLDAVLPPTTENIRGQQNRAAEPTQPDFVVAWPLRYERLSTNETSYYDNELTGSITGSTLTVTAFAQFEGGLASGMTLTDGTAGLISSPTTVLQQLSGSVGGTGTYTVAPPQTVPSGALYSGVRADLTPTSWTVQLDVHGPNAANAAQTLINLIRSKFAVMQSVERAASTWCPYTATKHGIFLS